MTLVPVISAEHLQMVKAFGLRACTWFLVDQSTSDDVQFSPRNPVFESRDVEV
jgi:hypothetical protein